MLLIIIDLGNLQTPLKATEYLYVLRLCRRHAYKLLEIGEIRVKLCELSLEMGVLPRFEVGGWI